MSQTRGTNPSLYTNTTHKPMSKPMPKGKGGGKRGC
jgi:hypothetical protein